MEKCGEEIYEDFGPAVSPRSGNDSNYFGSVIDVDAESGVEPDSSEWIFQDITDSVEFDITAEQASATLRYFTSTSERANMLTKTHYDDLDVISDLLQEKEKDLELAAAIGQSLLQRNKNLFLKIESMERYLSQVSEREEQLQHELRMKSNMIKQMLIDEQEFERSSFDSDFEARERDGFGDATCSDESMNALQLKCDALEEQNSYLFHDVLALKNQANEAEEMEHELVLDVVNQLALAKESITNLTDEIAQKFEDNVQQQEEITELISTVVELQRKHRQLSAENQDLHQQLDDSQQNQEVLKLEVIQLQRKFEECHNLLQENQEEVKTLRNKVEYEQVSWSSNPDITANSYQQDSLALEIEESVRRNLHSHQDRRNHTTRVMNSVRTTNRYLDRTSNYSQSNSGRLSPVSSVQSEVSADSDDNRSVSIDFRSRAGSQEDGMSAISNKSRRTPFLAPERLQIVKPMEGSMTLHQWQQLASQNVKAGLNVGQMNNHSTTYAEDQEPDLPKGLSLLDLDDDIFEDNSDNDDDGGIVFSIKSKSDNGGLEMKSSTPTNDSGTGNTNHQQQSSASVPEPNFASTSPVTSKVEPSKIASKNQETGATKRTQIRDLRRFPKRTIITRNSSILNALKEGRQMLNQNGKDSKSKVEVMDILANAMSKVNVEAKAGKRILESISSNNLRDRSASQTHKKDYPEMPKLSKVLEKLASSKNPHENILGKVSTSKNPQEAPHLKLKKFVDNHIAEVSKTQNNVTKTSSEQNSKPTNLQVPGSLQADANSVVSSTYMLPSLLGGPVDLAASQGIMGRLIRSSELLQPVQTLSSLLTVPEKEPDSTHKTLTRSLSSGDIQKLSKNNLASLGDINPNKNEDDNVIGRIRRNSSSGGLATLDTSKEIFGLRRRTNSSGSLTDLLRQSEIKPITAGGSSPNNNSPPSFTGFDLNDFSDFMSGSFMRSSSGGTSSVTMTTTTTIVSSTTTTMTTSAIPSGFLRGLFLGGVNKPSLPEPKRPSSVYQPLPQGTLGSQGSASSAESGLNRFGKAFAMDDFGGFGFMSMFGSKSSNDPS